MAISDMARKLTRDSARAVPAFDVQAFLLSSGVPKTVVEYSRGETIFTQGEACEHVLYIRSGGVKLSVLSKSGREAVVAMLGPSDFFGEGCLAGQPFRMGSATAITPTVILMVRKEEMVRLLHTQHAMSDRFIRTCWRATCGLKKTSSINSSSVRRLARALLLLARYGAGQAGPASSRAFRRRRSPR